MSRIGKKPITVPQGVSVKPTGGVVEVKGPKGVLTRDIPPSVALKLDGSSLLVERQGNSRQARAMHGLARSLLQNMVTGVTTGFVRELKIEGVGYRAEVAGQEMKFNVGYSNPVIFPLPKGIAAEIGGRGVEIKITGIDKELLGRVAAKIRAIRPPEPYKGKGIRYKDERVRRKVGKAGVG